MHRTLIYVAVAMAGIAAIMPAFACGTGRVAFSDNFDALNSKVWGNTDKWMSVKDGKLVLSQSNGDFYAVDSGRKFRDVDYCAVGALTAGTDITAAYGGVTFWLRSSKDFYTFQITLDGFADVYRYDGDWTALVDDRAFPAIKQGIGAVNELRVVTHANTATFFVNGVRFDSITDKRPPGTSRVGLVVDSPPSGSVTFAFDAVQVRDPEGN
jgi:hypothetical protein